MNNKPKYLWKVTFSDVRNEFDDVICAKNLSDAVDKVYKMRGDVCDNHLLGVSFFGVLES